MRGSVLGGQVRSNRASVQVAAYNSLIDLSTPYKMIKRRVVRVKVLSPRGPPASLPVCELESRRFYKEVTATLTENSD
jgi:hypothetical protein